MADRAMEATTAARCRRKAPGREDRRVAHGGPPAHLCVGIDAALAGVLGCLASHRGVQHLASSGKVVKQRGGTDCEVGAASRRRRQTLHMGRLALAGAALTCTRCTSWPLVRKVLAAHETVSAAGGAAEGAGHVGSERASERRRRQQAAAAACRTLRAGTPSGFLTHARSRSGRKCGLKQLACAAANPARPERPPGLAPRSGCAANHRRHLRSTSRRPPAPPARSVRRQQTRCCPWLESRCGGDQGEGSGLTARKLRNRP